MGRFTFIVLLVLASSQTSYGCFLNRCGQTTYPQYSQQPTIQYVQPTYTVAQPTYQYVQQEPTYTAAQPTQTYVPVHNTTPYYSNSRVQNSTPVRTPQQASLVKKLDGFNFLFGNGQVLFYWGADKRPHLIALDKASGQGKTFSFKEMRWVPIPDKGNALELQRELALYYQIPEVKNAFYDPRTKEGDKEKLERTQRYVTNWNRTFENHLKDYPGLKPITPQEIALASRRFSGIDTTDGGVQPYSVASATPRTTTGTGTSPRARSFFDPDPPGTGGARAGGTRQPPPLSSGGRRTHAG
jgi:hypothetical protein